MLKQLIADLMQARQTDAAKVIIKQFTQAGARLQPVMCVQFAAGRDHAAYDAAELILLKPGAVGL